MQKTHLAFHLGSKFFRNLISLKKQKNLIQKWFSLWNFEKSLSLILGILWILCLPPAYTLETIYLKESLRQAKKGDYIITAQNKMATAWIVTHIDQTTLTIEEISIPNHLFPKQGSSWLNWLEKKAPGNTSWIQFKVDLSSGQVHSWYSRTNQRFFQLPQSENILATLLQLPLQEIPPPQRKRVGMKLPEGKIDNRPIWEPPLTYNGQRIQGATFFAWRTKWPKDQSPLSEQIIEVYTPKSGPYPNYFPYWIQIKGLAGQAKVRIIDSGSYQQRSD